MRGGTLGAYRQRWPLRRRTLRKKHTLRWAEKDTQRKELPHGASRRHPIVPPINAQLSSAFVLFAVVIVLCFIGQDHINPDLPFFSFPTSKSTGKKRRDVTTESKAWMISSRITPPRNPSGLLQLSSNRRHRLCLVSSRRHICFEGPLPSLCWLSPDSSSLRRPPDSACNDA